MNKAILIGNLTKDPESNIIGDNTSVCKFTIAVNRSYTKKDGTRDADFIPIVCWRGTADICSRYLRKGSKVGICGNIQTRSYEANDGTKRYITEVVADEVQFLSSKGSSNGYDDVEELPEVSKKNSTNRASELKPVEDVELPF